jgi:hypothetical protein
MLGALAISPLLWSVAPTLSNLLGSHNHRKLKFDSMIGKSYDAAPDGRTLRSEGPGFHQRPREPAHAGHRGHRRPRARWRAGDGLGVRYSGRG